MLLRVYFNDFRLFKCCFNLIYSVRIQCTDTVYGYSVRKRGEPVQSMNAPIYISLCCFLLNEVNINWVHWG